MSEANLDKLPQYLQETPSTESEKERFVRHYIEDTGFPNATEKIRHHLRGVISLATLETQTPIVYAACDYNCSVGEGGNRAVPGSDVDALYFFTERPLRLEQNTKFIDSMLEKVNPMLVTITQYSLTPTWFKTLSDLERWNMVDWTKPETQTKIPQGSYSELRACMKEIVYGTSLFERPNTRLTSLRESLSGETIPFPQKEGELETSNSVRRRRYEARAVLGSRFSNLDIESQYAIVRANLHFSPSVHYRGDPIDFSLSGKDAALLNRLADLGLFHRANMFFTPAWK